MVHRGPTSYLMYAVLVFQLAVGMDWPVAHAATVPQQGQPGGMEMARCPEHASLGVGAGGPDTHNGQVEGSADHDPSHHPEPPAKHHCCRSAGCQCHCAFTPASLARRACASWSPLVTSCLRLTHGSPPPFPKNSSDPPSNNTPRARSDAGSPACACEGHLGSDDLERWSLPARLSSRDFDRSSVLW